MSLRRLDRLTRIEHPLFGVNRAWPHIEEKPGAFGGPVTVIPVSRQFLYLAGDPDLPVSAPAQGSGKPFSGLRYYERKMWGAPTPIFRGLRR